MAKDFEQLGHKNIELLRFYLSKDIKRIDKKIDSNESNLISYFIASLVDIFVVVLFDDLVKDFIKCKMKNIPMIWQILARLGCIALLIGLFCGVVCLIKKVLKRIQQKKAVSGELEYNLKPKQQEKIDDFDNIACDGLLICQHYIQRFSESGIEEHVKAFYFYEVIHHLEKSRRKFSEIYENQELYIATKENNYDSELIDTYRVNNFIDFSGKILEFLKNHISEMEQNPDLIKDMDNLDSKISVWEKVE